MTAPIPKRAIFLDRDGTIIEDRGHIGSVKDVEFFPFAFEALKMLQKEYLLFIVTNQSGVGLGMVSMEAAAKVNSYVMEQLSHRGITVQELYCCFHKKDDNCDCMKPKPYFIHEARRAHAFDVSQSYSIGDHPHDVSFGKNAGGNGIYLLTGHGTKHFNNIEPGTVCFENLYDAACGILKKPIYS